MLNPNATRHLRGVTALQQAAGASGLSTAASLGHGSSPGSPSSQGTTPLSPVGSEEGTQVADWSWRHHRQQSQNPTGACKNATSILHLHTNM